jgi:hypothetical protein
VGLASARPTLLWKWHRVAAAEHGILGAMTGSDLVFGVEIDVIVHAERPRGAELDVAVDEQHVLPPAAVVGAVAGLNLIAFVARGCVGHEREVAIH